MSLRPTLPVLWGIGRRCWLGSVCHLKPVLYGVVSLPCCLSMRCRAAAVAGRLLPTRSFASPPSVSPSQSVSSNIAPIVSKKRVKRKKPVVNRDSAEEEHSEVESQSFKVAAYSTAEEYDLEGVLSVLKGHNSFRLMALPDDVDDVLYVSLPAGAKSDRQPALHEVLVFRQGTAVFWNVPPSVCTRFLRFLTTYEEGSYDAHTVQDECEELEYSFCQQRGARLSSGRIFLSQPASHPPSSVSSATCLQMYAFSNALSLSVKLGVWEAALQRYIESMSHVTEELQRGGRIRMCQQQVLRKNGELFGLRHAINLSSDCLDTPDFYWDREHLERLYRQTCIHLNIGKRTRVMNEKLNHCVELAGMLASNLQDRHHVRLEWMIIALIMVEVGFELFHFIER